MSERATTDALHLVPSSTSVEGREPVRQSKGISCSWCATHWDKLVYGSVLLALVVTVSVALPLAMRHPNGKLPPPNHIHLVIRDGERARFSKIEGTTLRGWQKNDSFGDEIVSNADAYGVFTVTKSGLYYLTTQVTFYNKAPHNTASLLINGVVWKQQVLSSPVQLNRKGEKEHSFSPCVVSSHRYLKKGDTIAIGTGYRGRHVSVLPMNTFFDMAELR